MTADELVRLQAPRIAYLLQKHATADPTQLVYALRDEYPQLAPAIATQLALRQQFAGKLPGYVRAGCLLERSLAEQATDEGIPPLRSLPTGTWAVDLTAGLGVDTIALARSFQHVTAIEADPVRAEMLRHNLLHLGIENVDLLHAKAEDWIRAQRETVPDFVFADPARRTDLRRKTVALADCTPDVTQLFSAFKAWRCQVGLKLSPLFDVREAMRLPSVASVSIHSLEGEVKEVFALLDFSSVTTQPVLQAAGSWQAQPWHVMERAISPIPTAPPAEYLLLPDAAIEKAGLTASFCVQYVVTGAAQIHPNGYLTAAEVPDGHIPARVLAVDHNLPYKPKHLRKQLPELGYGTAVMHRKQFPKTVAEVRKELGVQEGKPVYGEPYPRYICLTETADGKRTLLCRRIR